MTASLGVLRHRPGPSPSALLGEHLVLRYGRSTVVHGASLDLTPGTVTALVGPNGSGKSTLLRSLARLHPVSGGTITLRTADDRRARDVSLVSAQEFAREVTLFTQTRLAPEGLSVRELVAFGRQPYRRRFAGLSAQDHGAIDRALAATGVQEMAERAAGELSGGELQRVWLAVCLAQDTGTVLLDEPTNHLDLRFQVETLELIRELAEERKVAVGVVLHDLDQAAQVADTLVLLSRGSPHATGTPEQVLTSENLTTVYGLPVEVHREETTGRLRIDPVAPRLRTRGRL